MKKGSTSEAVAEVWQARTIATVSDLPRIAIAKYFHYNNPAKYLHLSRKGRPWPGNTLGS